MESGSRVPASSWVRVRALSGCVVLVVSALIADHVVEQSQIGRSGFAPEEIHNPFNMNLVGARTNQIKADYSRKLDLADRGTVRDFLTGKSYAYQYNFGMQILGQIEEEIIR